MNGRLMVAISIGVLADCVDGTGTGPPILPPLPPAPDALDPSYGCSSADTITTVPGPDTPRILAHGQRGALGIAIDAANVYWANAQEGTVRSVPRGGGAVITLAAQQAEPSFIAVDATNVYFTNRGSDTVMAVPISGGTVRRLAALQDRPNAIVLSTDGDTLFWTTGRSAVTRLALDGGPPVALVQSERGANLLAVDAAFAYYTIAFTTYGNIGRIPLAGGWPTQVGTSTEPTGVAVDSAHVYWTDATVGLVVQAAVDGRAPRAIACGIPSPLGIAVVGETVYVASQRLGLLRIPVSGGPVTLLASGQAQHVVLDATTAYFTDLSGMIVAIPR